MLTWLEEQAHNKTRGADGAPFTSLHQRYVV